MTRGDRGVKRGIATADHQDVKVDLTRLRHG
jgi:hypothetical protein